MRALRLLLALGVMGLHGCGVAQQAQLQKQRQDLEATHAADVADCNRRFPNKLQKPVVPLIKCLGEADMKAARAMSDPNADLYGLLAAKMVEAGERYDGGKLTPSQFDVEKATIISSINSQLLQRQNAATLATAAQNQAQAQQAAAWAANRPRSCNTIGSTTTCY